MAINLSLAEEQLVEAIRESTVPEAHERLHLYHDLKVFFRGHSIRDDMRLAHFLADALTEHRPASEE
jgi:hypothetical protein